MLDNRLKLEGLPIELKFLLDVLGNKAESTFNYQRQKKFDWSLFLELVIHHRLFPGLITKLRNIEDNECPIDVLQQLQHWHQSNTFQMLQLTAEMDKINQVFCENNIRSLFLKGPFLGDILYGDLSLRTSSDLDLLVPLKDLETVEELLQQMGYVKDDYIETILNDWKWRHHHFSFIHPHTNVKVEVHWRLNPGPGKEPNFEKLWANKQEWNFLNLPLFFLGNEELFFFLVTHGARHGWSRLRWLMDIYQMTNKKIDWEEVRKLFNNYHNLCIAGQAMILVSQLIGTKVEGQAEILDFEPIKSFQLAEEALFYVKKMVNLHSLPLTEEISRYHKRHLIHIMSSYQKRLFYLSFLFPYPEDANVVPLPKKLHFLYFLLRPILWIWRKQITQEVGG
jgi:hypothetical protein